MSGSNLFNEKELIRVLRAASHRERAGWRAPGRGRRPRYDDAILREVWRALRDELKRETRSAIAPRTFTEQYVRLLTCPKDILEPLSAGRINLFEALQLARIKASPGGLDEAGATHMRARVLAAHLAAYGSASQLYERIDALLNTKAPAPTPVSGLGPAHGEVSPGGSDEDLAVEEIEALAEAYMADPGALFADQLRQVTFAISQLEPLAVTEADTISILDLLDQLYLRATRAARRARNT